MSSRPPRQQHLDASQGREVVYCHGCNHEWYRDQGGSLLCPSCHGDITEIVDPANDPRAEIPPPASSYGHSFFRSNFPPDHSDSDPDEANIDDFTPRGSVPRPPRGNGPLPSFFNDPIMARFRDMIQHDLGAGAGAGDNGVREGRGPRIHTTTWTGPMGGTTTFTVTSGPLPSRPSGGNFNSLLGDLMRGVPRSGAEGHAGAAAGPRGAGGGMNLPELLQALMNPAAARFGDAVYTQEALDEIITRLMEANPQSNAAPPASQAALDRLTKKKVDESMLGTEGKVECTICLDEVKKGNEVTELPCKHWFHSDCVTLWLKEHNTCPICRAPIEERGNNNNNNFNSSSSSNNNRSRNMGVFIPISPGPVREPSIPYTTSAFPSNTADRRQRPARSQREREERLSTIRSLANSRSSSYNSHSSGQRRSSASPPTQRSTSATESVNRRVRSPSQQRTRDADQDGSGRQRQDSGSSASGHNPLSWIRNTLNRARDGSEQDKRRS